VLVADATKFKKSLRFQVIPLSNAQKAAANDIAAIVCMAFINTPSKQLRNPQNTLAQTTTYR
jgi:hypothetical protein